MAVMLLSYKKTRGHANKPWLTMSLTKMHIGERTNLSSNAREVSFQYRSRQSRSDLRTVSHVPVAVRYCRGNPANVAVASTAAQRRRYLPSQFPCRRRIVETGGTARQAKKSRSSKNTALLA